MIYIVRTGDYLSKIAVEHGFTDWHVIYNHPDNAEFRRLRPNPNLIYPGDHLVIPDRGNKQVPAATGGEARFRARRSSNTLQVTLIDFQRNPLANKTCMLEVNDAARSVTTDGSGRLHADIPGDLTHARLLVDGVAMTLEIGRLNPMDDVDGEDVSGVQGRLANLGYYGGRIHGELDDATREAVRAFQRDNDLPESGEVSRSLKDKLQQRYGG